MPVQGEPRKVGKGRERKRNREIERGAQRPSLELGSPRPVRRKRTLNAVCAPRASPVANRPSPAPRGSPSFPCRPQPRTESHSPPSGTTPWPLPTESQAFEALDDPLWSPPPCAPARLARPSRCPAKLPSTRNQVQHPGMGTIAGRRTTQNPGVSVHA